MPMANNPVSLKLEEIGLEQYASALIDDQGYDSMTTLQGLTKEEAGAIADEIKMKPGHKRRFVEGIANLPPLQNEWGQPAERGSRYISTRVEVCLAGSTEYV